MDTLANPVPQFAGGRAARVLDAVRQGATVRAAAESAGVPKSTVYYWLQHRPFFARALRHAKAEALIAIS